jgi:hypothetical protein
VSFLGGNEMPIVEYVGLNEQSLALEFRGFFDFGCAPG